MTPATPGIAICGARQCGAPGAALFIAIFSVPSVREPEVFADLILRIHTLKTPGVALNYVNPWRLRKRARSLPAAGLLVARRPPNPAVPQPSGRNWPCGGA